MERSLQVIPTIKDAFAIGIKNAPSLVLTSLLYILTIWIPYINVGTTIAMATLPGKLAQGEIINPTFIFGSVYRRRMGSFFLLLGFMYIMLVPAFFFMIIPAIVILMMYCLALYIMIDKDVTPTEALELSNKATYGFKWKIFWVNFIFALILILISAILHSVLGSDFTSKSGAAFAVYLIVWIVYYLLAVCCDTALEAVIYRNLFLRPQQSEVTADEDTKSEETPADPTAE